MKIPVWMAKILGMNEAVEQQSEATKKQDERNEAHRELRTLFNPRYRQLATYRGAVSEIEKVHLIKDPEYGDAYSCGITMAYYTGEKWIIVENIYCSGMMDYIGAADYSETGSVYRKLLSEVNSDQAMYGTFKAGLHKVSHGVSDNTTASVNIEFQLARREATVYCQKYASEFKENIKKASNQQVLDMLKDVADLGTEIDYVLTIRTEAEKRLEVLKQVAMLDSLVLMT